MILLEPADQRFSFDGKLCPPPRCDPGLTPVETEVETLDGCPYYKCMNRYTRPTCPTPSCPPGFSIQFIVDSNSAPMKLTQADTQLTEESSLKRPKRYATKGQVDECPRFECVPVEVEEEIQTAVAVDKKCSYIGRTMTTFDDLVYKQDLCHHVLMESVNHDWKIECKFIFCIKLSIHIVIADHKICRNQNCKKFLHINIDAQTLSLSEDLKIEFNKNTYSTKQARRLTHTDLFDISQIGDTILLTSKTKQLWIQWQKNGQVEIGVWKII